MNPIKTENLQLLKAIGPSDLTGYFEYLDELRTSGITNMWGATPYLMDHFTGMSKQEARTVLLAWVDTFSNTLPCEDRVDQLLDK